jgi:hypothetical protein
MNGFTEECGPGTGEMAMNRTDRNKKHDASAAMGSMTAANEGDFRLLAERLRSGAVLAPYELDFLVDLLRGEELLFVIKRRDGRRYHYRHLHQRRRIAAFVHIKILAGMNLSEAIAEADEVFRPGLNPRPATIRNAYREFFPNGSASISP